MTDETRQEIARCMRLVCPACAQAAERHPGGAVQAPATLQSDGHWRHPNRFCFADPLLRFYAEERITPVLTEETRPLEKAVRMQFCRAPVRRGGQSFICALEPGHEGDHA